MKDIQSQIDTRMIEIDQVGICDIVYPILVKDRANGVQNTIATISMSVNLAHNIKGTHMSRFVEVLNKHKDNIGVSSLNEVLVDIRDSLNADRAHIELKFKYFVEKKAPVSSKSGFMDYDCKLSASLDKNIFDLVCTVSVPVMSLCPCSKEISNYGAHNQRSIVDVSVRSVNFVWLEELIEYVENSASSPLYSLLKREDEKFITEVSYDNPAFVEDIVRNLTVSLNNDSRVIWFEVSSTNMESIHNHNAWAKIVRDKRVKTKNTEV